MFYRLFNVLALLFILCSASTAQVFYTPYQLESTAPLPWQVQYDPANRLTIGNSDGNVTAAAHATTYASVIRYGGADGQGGLLDAFTVASDGTVPTAFGLARSGCVVSDANSINSCIKVRWIQGFSPSLMVAIAGSSFHIEGNVVTGDSFAIERMPNGVVNFYRSTGIPDEWLRVFSASSPFASDGGSGAVEVRAAFAPESVAVHLLQGRELYYCHPSAGCL